MTRNDDITRIYGPGANRNWWGVARWRWLLSSGQYVRSGEQCSARAVMPLGLRVVGEAGPGVVDFNRKRPGNRLREKG